MIFASALIALIKERLFGAYHCFSQFCFSLLSDLVHGVYLLSSVSWRTSWDEHHSPTTNNNEAKGSKICGILPTFAVQNFPISLASELPHQSPSSGKDLILINCVRIINSIDFRLHVSSPRKPCMESKHVFILLNEFGSPVRKVEFCF